jgi:hypothetical protein
MDSAVEISAPATAINISGNAFFGSFDTHTVLVNTPGNSILNNAALGTFKVPVSKFDDRLAATYGIFAGGNIVRGNLAAGSDRLGFDIVGDACDSPSPGISDNHAQSCTIGMIPRATDVPGKTCTLVSGFTASFSWDFGLLTLSGIPTDLELRDCSFVNSKHAAVLPMRKGGMMEVATVRYVGGSVVGVTHPDICSVRAQNLWLTPLCRPHGKAAPL